jgi:putative Mn2+ efflux pump MntP
VVAKLLALILPLGLDTFAVAAAIGMVGPPPRLRISLLFSAFEAGMPLIGVALGAPLGRAIGSAADYVAIAVLIVFGAWTLLEGQEPNAQALRELAGLRGAKALLLGVAISVDELAIGFTLGLLGVSVVLVVALIALQTVTVTELGLRLGKRLSERARDGAERLAGVALTALGVVLLAEKLLG